MTNKSNTSRKYINKNRQVQKMHKAVNSLETALRIGGNAWNDSLSTWNAYTNIKYDLISWQQYLINNLYKTYGILATIVKQPVDDAFRNGAFELESDTLSAEELEELYNTLIMSGDILAFKKTGYWARCFGGSALIALTGDLKKPLNKNKLEGQPLEFLAVDRWRLQYSKSNINIPDGIFNVIQTERTEANTLNQIDYSKLKIMKGVEAPFIIEQELQGWGMSVFEQIFQQCSQYFKSQNVIFELLDEAKTDILKLSTLSAALSSANGEAALQRMVDMIARCKNYKSQITLSTSDDYEQKQISFSGLAEIMKEIRILISACAKMPIAKIWGIGSSGFSSGEDDLENYNAMVENEVREPMMPIIKWAIDLRCIQLFGRKIPDLRIIWKPLRVLSAIDMQNIDDHKVANALQLFDRQLLSPQEIMEYLKKENIFVMDTKAIRGELEDEPLFNNQTQDTTKLVDITKE